MFSYLKSVFTLKGIKRKAIIELLNISETALYNKLAGRTEFTLQECLLIKNFLKTTDSIEVLFKKSEVNDGKR